MLSHDGLLNLASRRVISKFREGTVACGHRAAGAEANVEEIRDADTALEKLSPWLGCLPFRTVRTKQAPSGASPYLGTEVITALI